MLPTLRLLRRLALLLVSLLFPHLLDSADAGATGARPPVQCASEFDCGFNGACVGSVCQCDKPWRGPQCSSLALGPASRSGGYNIPSTTSWGGSALRGDDGRYWMWAAEMVNEMNHA